MEKSHFFALASRLKYIQRWGLMRNTTKENVQEHSAQVAMVAHGLALIGNAFHNRHYDANLATVVALYHDIEEIYTGDIPTPVKQTSPEANTIHKHIAEAARERLLSILPSRLRNDYAALIHPESNASVFALVKAADKICALIKCLEELNSGNHEFHSAHDQIKTELNELATTLPEINTFLALYLDSFSQTLDQLQKPAD